MFYHFHFWETMWESGAHFADNAQRVFLQAFYEHSINTKNKKKCCFIFHTGFY